MIWTILFFWMLAGHMTWLLVILVSAKRDLPSLAEAIRWMFWAWLFGPVLMLYPLLVRQVAIWVRMRAR